MEKKKHQNPGAADIIMSKKYKLKKELLNITFTTLLPKRILMVKMNLL